MGFDCFVDFANKNTKLALAFSTSGSLVNDQILREIGNKLNEMLASPTKRLIPVSRFFT